MQRLPFALSLLAAALVAPAWAQGIAPDAGSVLREQQQPLVPPRGTAAPLAIPADSDTGADTGMRFAVRGIRLEGNRAYADAELLPLMQAVTGRDASLGELRQAARRITAYYRERGYIVARAFIPAQELRGGIVTIQVLEGTMHGNELRNASRVQDAVMQRYIDAQGLQGEVIRNKDTDRLLLLLADLPAVGKVDGLLRPGQAVGTSDLVVTAQAGRTRDFEVSADNLGNRYTGEHRLNAAATFHSPARLGDRLSLRASVTDEQLVFGRAHYDLPVGGNGLRLGAAVAHTSYQLGREFEALDARGTASTVGLTATYPVVRGVNTNLTLLGALDRRELRDEVRSTGAQTRRGATALGLDLAGDHADALLGGGYSTARLSLTLGQLDIRTPAALAADQATVRTDGGYHKLGFGATRLQAITPTTSAFVAFTGQYAGGNLDSSEKFVLGGINGVRAYPQGEAAGDHAWLTNVELRQNLASGVQGAVFYDVGGVRFLADPVVPGASNGVTLRGWGVSLAGVHAAGWQGRVTVAWRDGRAAVTAPDRSPRVWFSLGKRF